MGMRGCNEPEYHLTLKLSIIKLKTTITELKKKKSPKGEGKGRISSELRPPGNTSRRKAEPTGAVGPA